MKILIGCEESQAVTIEFRKLGHEAYSCDLKPCSGGHPEWHLQIDIFEALELMAWDMFIFFPPCTYVCSSGLHWNKRRPERQAKTDAAIQFVKDLWAKAESLGIGKVAMENPVGCLSTQWKKPSQYIQPYQFGDDASKNTCLWLKGLPLLVPTIYFPPRIVDGKPRWGNQTDSGQNKETPQNGNEARAEIRSKTYPGIAKAMAYQFVNIHNLQLTLAL